MNETSVVKLYLAIFGEPASEEVKALIGLKEGGEQALRQELLSLNPRDQKVLELRFGLEDGRSRSLKEVGREFNVTLERIRQIETRALRKLRHPSHSRYLKDYLK